MLSTLKKSWQDPGIRVKLLFVFAMIIVYRLGNTIPIPFMNKDVIAQVAQANQSNNIFSLINTLSGESLSKMSIFALNIYPYITASIIFQLLTVAIPKFSEIAKDGEAGRKKMTLYTKIGAIIIAWFEAYAIIKGLFNSAIVNRTPFATVVMFTTIIGGTMFLVWLGEIITEKGVGNGSSIIIFIGIVSGLPKQILSLVATHPKWWVIIILLIVSFVVLLAIIAINEGERKIPIHYAKRVVGRKMYGGQSSSIPVKVNMANVMPVIFSTSILALPQMVGLIMKNPPKWLNIFSTTTTSGLVLYSIVNFILIIIFAYFYNAIQFNTVEYTKNLQQNGGFIPGIRPGKPTGDYLQKVVNRITLIGAIILGIVASVPTVLSSLLGVKILFGGTALIIVVGVVIDTIKQLDVLLTMKHYKGFLNK